MPHRPLRAGRSRGGSGSARHLRIQRKRIRGGVVRQLPGARCPIQCELPLRQERAAISAGRCGCDRPDLPRRVRPAGSRGPAGSAAAARPDPDRRRLGKRVALRRGGLRGRHRGRCEGVEFVEPPGRAALPRRLVRPVHRWHDGDAEGSAVAPARHLHDVLRWPQSLHRRAGGFPRRDRGGGTCRGPPAPS